jgi:trans-aconitate 2-methyltransferase
MANPWNSELYDQAHSFVWKFGADLLPMLDPKPGEHIVDLGCGTGHLTAEIARAGARVIGIDSSAEMIEQARARYPTLEFRRADARSFAVDAPVDAVFSNAALHWVTDAEPAVESIARALKPGGRFVAEFGGKGNIAQLLAGAFQVLRRHRIEPRNPWYFPSIGEYAALLERHNLEVSHAALFDRMTALEDNEDAMRDWLRMFGTPLIEGVSEAERPAILGEIAEQLEPMLRRDGRWYADYRRIRVSAVKR